MPKLTGDKAAFEIYQKFGLSLPVIILTAAAHVILNDAEIARIPNIV